KELAWWPHLLRFNSHYVEVLRYVDTISSAKYTFTTEPPTLGAPTLSAFFVLLPHVYEVVKSVLQTLDAGCTNYERYAEGIENYLHRGVVPSTILNAKGEFEHPDPISVINVAYKIHLESINVLLTQVGQDVKSVEARGEWSKRLEIWASKAFED